MNTTQPLKTEQLVDAQGEAIAELKHAQALRARGGASTPGRHTPLLTAIEKQELYVAENVQRCPRCGAHVVHIVSFWPSGALCAACMAFLRSIDGALLWFIDIVRRAQS